MGKRSHQMLIREETDFGGYTKIAASFRLPVADEFVCDDEEVREVCALLEVGHEGILD